MNELLVTATQTPLHDSYVVLLWCFRTMDSTAECDCKAGRQKNSQTQRIQSGVTFNSSPTGGRRAEKFWLSSKRGKLISGNQLMGCYSFPVCLQTSLTKDNNSLQPAEPKSTASWLPYTPCPCTTTPLNKLHYCPHSLPLLSALPFSSTRALFSWSPTPCISVRVPLLPWVLHCINMLK